MKTFAAILTAAAIFFGAASESQAGFAPISLFNGFTRTQPQIIATVSLSQQRMNLTIINGFGDKQTLTWKVSTGRAGLETPTGAYKPTWLDIDHKSETYDDAPMPYAVFFSGGYAIHATEYVKRLGTPASHGCVRLAPENAAAFYKLVKSYGKANTKIVITN